MQNDFTNIIPLVFTKGYPILEDNIVYPLTVMRYTAVASASQGDVLSVKISNERSTTPIAPSNTLYDPPGHSKTVRTIALKNWNQSGFHLNPQEMHTFDWRDDFAQQMAEATEAMARDINLTHQNVYKQSYLSVGSPGTDLFGGSDGDANAGINRAIEARRILLQNKAMPGNDISLFISHEVQEQALNATAISRADYSGDTLAINEAVIGRKAGVNWFGIHSLDEAEHEAGMGGSPQIAAAAALGSTTIQVDGATSSAVEGDLFTISGDTQQYVVIEVTNTDGGDEYTSGESQTLTISPALKSAAANDAALTVVGDHKFALMYHKDAIGNAFRQLPTAFETGNLVDTSNFSVPMDHKNTQIPMVFEGQYQNKRWVFDVSALWGVGVLRPEHMVRLIY